MTVLIGLDVGERRIGVAVADRLSGAVRPLRTINRTEPARDGRTVARIAAEAGAQTVVIGLPLDSRGGIGPQAAATQRWAEEALTGLPLAIRWRDERHTSMAAEARIGAAPRSSSGGPPSPAARRAWRARVDREAAAAILQAELDSLATEEQG